MEEVEQSSNSTDKRNDDDRNAGKSLRAESFFFVKRRRCNENLPP